MQTKPSQLGEFDLIQRFFADQSAAMLADEPGAISLGIGDDCALFRCSTNEEVAITSDMLVSGRHFFSDTNPEWLGWKALAVNLSDLAAMGAKPIGFTLAISLPNPDIAWLEGFSRGLFAIAKRYSCPLVGGDTTAGPLNICITAFGSIPLGKGIKRSGALIDDDVWVSGMVGDARLTLAAMQQEITLSAEDFQTIQSRMHQPTPRIALGMALQGRAHSAVDISDGLLGDLMHILEKSNLDAQILLDRLPKSAILLKQPLNFQQRYAAKGGDDYELCFTAPINLRPEIEQISQNLALPLTRIGKITAKNGPKPQVEILDATGNKLGSSETSALLQSFDHFA